MSTYDLLVDQVLVLSDVGDLQEHGGDEVDALELLQVDVHVIWHLPLQFLFLKLNGFVNLPADALGQDLA